MIGLLWKRSKREKDLADALREMSTLRVSQWGGISIDSQEILRNQNFIDACKRAKKIVV